MANIAGGAIEGAINHGITTVSANYTLVSGDELLQVTTGASNVIITLPDPTLASNKGIRSTIQKVDTGAGLAVVTGNLNIGGVYNLTLRWSSVQVICDGVRWNVISTVS